MQKLLTHLKYNPIKALLAFDNSAINYFVKRDLESQQVPPVDTIWTLPEVIKILRKQQQDGSWKYPRKMGDMQRPYNMLETFRQIGILIEMYGLNSNNEAIENAAKFLFSFQTEEGDFRGIYGNQYSPNYSATIVEHLIKAGYENDKHIIKCLEWLLTMRQDEGGWVIPVRTRLKTLSEMYNLRETLQPDRTRPFSHFATDIILRAFASHPDYSNRQEIWHAGELLKSEFFMPDKYPDHKSASSWVSFQFPFWWSHLLSSLNSLAEIGFKETDTNIHEGLDWFIKNQDKYGLWPTGYGSDKTNPNRKGIKFWVGLTICKMLKKYYGNLILQPI